MVRDPYWLHAYWELAQRSVDRAQAAMGQHWHGAQPVLRLFRMHGDAAAVHERDIAIHGGVSNWYVDVQDPPADYRLEIGYLADDGYFYCLARSNEVSTPPAGTSDAVDENWTAVAENADRIFAMSGGYSPQGASRELQELLEERLRRPLGSPMKTRYGSGAAAHREGEQLRVRRRRRDHRLRRRQPRRPRHAAGRAGAAARRRHVRRAAEPARPPAGDPDRRQLVRRRRAADDHSGRRAEHEGDGTAGPRRRPSSSD